MKQTYTKDEVIELLAAYKYSDSGTFSVAEAKLQWPNTFKNSMEIAADWLENVAKKTIYKRAKDWFFDRHEDFRASLVRMNPGKSIKEIYVITMVRK